MHEDDLRAALREHAVATERASRPTTAEAAMRRAAPATHRSPALLVAMSVALFALLAVALWVREREVDRELDTAQDPPTTTEPTTTSVPGDPYVGVSFEDLPDGGIAVVTDDDTVLVLAEDGAQLAEITDSRLVTALGDDQAKTGVAIWLGQPPMAEAAPPDPAEAPAGCEGARGAGGVRVARCGGEDQRRTQIVQVMPDGAIRVLADAAPGSDGVGHWRVAMPSPDGEWILAQWSGECESPTAVLIPVAGGEPTAVTGEPVITEAPESAAVGWTEDGEAIVELSPGLCGAGADEPGTYLVDPTTGQRELVRSSSSPREVAYRWGKAGEYVNAPERTFHRALQELDLEGCCGEPSHGGPAVTSGAHWNGVDIPVYGAPGGPLLDGDVISSEPAEIDGLPVVVGEADLGAFAAFTCGGVGWTIGGVGLGDRATEQQVIDLTAALIPHLYCTVGARPEADGHGDPDAG